MAYWRGGDFADSRLRLGGELGGQSLQVTQRKPAQADTSTTLFANIETPLLIGSTGWRLAGETATGPATVLLLKKELTIKHSKASIVGPAAGNG